MPDLDSPDSSTTRGVRLASPEIIAYKQAGSYHRQVINRRLQKQSQEAMNLDKQEFESKHLGLAELKQETAARLRSADGANNADGLGFEEKKREMETKKREYKSFFDDFQCRMDVFGADKEKQWVKLFS